MSLQNPKESFIIVKFEKAGENMIHQSMITFYEDISPPFYILNQSTFTWLDRKQISVI